MLTSFYMELALLSFFLSGVSFIPFINFLYRLKFIRRKEAPKKGKVPLFDKLHDHKAGTPIGGGILVIVLSTLLYVMAIFTLGFNLQEYCIYSFMDEVHVILLTFLGFGVLGLFDDWVKIFGKGRKGTFGQRFGITERAKFLIQWGLGLLVGSLMYFNLNLDFIHIPLTSLIIPLGPLFIPFAAFVIVSFSNAYNITDGLDGLSSGLFLIALLAFVVIAYSVLDMPIAIFLAILIGSIIAFLYFNVYPARIWLGDAGALSFGATLGVIGLLTGKIFALVFIGGIFVVEVVSSLIQMVSLRAFGKRVFPLAPLHHTFEAIGWQEPKIVSRAWLTAIVLAIFGLWLALG